jgi:hypothetical protein
MKKYARILVALTFLLGLGVAAKAEVIPLIVVTMPFDFVVGGKTLPAGTYTASRLPYAGFRILQLTSRADDTSVFFLSADVESASANKPYVTLKQVGEKHFLSSIQTADKVYAIPVSRSVILEAAAKSHDLTSLSGSAGGR